MGTGTDSIDIITGDIEKFESDFTINIGSGWERIFWKWFGMDRNLKQKQRTTGLGVC